MVRRIEDPRHGELGLIEIPRTFHAPAGWEPTSALPELTGIVAVDLETKDPGIAGGTGPSWPFQDEGFICGVSICWAGGKAYYPLRHAAGNLERDEVSFFVWLDMQLSKLDVVAVMANASYDTGWLKRRSVRLANPPADVQVMAFLLDEHRDSYKLSDLGRHYLKRDKSTAALYAMAKSLHIPRPMENMDKLPAWVVEPYALDDAELTYDLYHHLIPRIAEQGLGDALALESKCSLVAVDMRMTGVRIDELRLEQLGNKFALERDRALERVYVQTGIRLQPFDNASAIKALHIEDNHVILGRTESGRDSVDRFTLARIGSPVAQAVLDSRKYEKARGTFVESLSKFIRRGRIHAEFHSTRNNSSNDDDVFGGNDSMYGAGSGRWASSKPNLQNIPARDEEIGPAVRSCFIPEPGEQWLKLDYASQEPRLTVHFAHAARQPGAQAMVDRFIANPLTDLHGECAALMRIDRKQAKTINLGLTYGMMGGKLCRELGLPTRTIVSRRTGNDIEIAGDEGEALLRKHFQAVPFIKSTFDLARSTAEGRGYVKTIIGQRMRFERYADGNYKDLHKALNKVIQGSAAAQMKMALVALREEGLGASLTVHDEADRSIPRGAYGDMMAKRMTDIMQDVLKLAVPFVVEAKTGENWGACK